MALKFYKYTGTMVDVNYDSAIPRPIWYGSDGTSSYALLDDEYVKLTDSTEDDLAVTTSSSAKVWVKTKSRQAKKIRKNCETHIRSEYTISQELKMSRINDTEGKAAIKAIVDVYTAQINALVGD